MAAVNRSGTALLRLSKEAIFVTACRHAFAADSLLSLVYQIVRGSYPPVPGELFTSGMIDLVGQLLTREAAERPSLQQVINMHCVKMPALCQQDSAAGFRQTAAV